MVAGVGANVRPCRAAQRHRGFRLPPITATLWRVYSTLCVQLVKPGESSGSSAVFDNSHAPLRPAARSFALTPAGTANIIILTM
jgi:hypothetical protein